MEHSRDNEMRGGHPGGSSAGEGGRQMPMSGFEGMNYEQRREPYYQKRRQQSSLKKDEESAAAKGNQDDDRI